MVGKWPCSKRFALSYQAGSMFTFCLSHVCLGKWKSCQRLWDLTVNYTSTRPSLRLEHLCTAEIILRAGSCPKTTASPSRAFWPVASRPGTGISPTTTIRPSSGWWRRPSTSVGPCYHPSRTYSQSCVWGWPAASSRTPHTPATSCSLSYRWAVCIDAWVLIPTGSQTIF